MGQNWIPRICRWLWVTVSLKNIPTSQKSFFDPYPSEHDDLTQTKLNSLKITVTPENYGMTWDDWRGPKRIGKLVKRSWQTPETKLNSDDPLVTLSLWNTTMFKYCSSIWAYLGIGDPPMMLIIIPNGQFGSSEVPHLPFSDILKYHIVCSIVQLNYIKSYPTDSHRLVG